LTSESKERFTLCASPPFNTLSTEKLKEIVQKRRQLLSGSRRRRDSFVKKTPSKIGCFSRPLALRPIYREIVSDAYTNFKIKYETELNTEIFGVRRFQILD